MKVADLVSPDVLESAPILAKTYGSAAPFPHIVIDNFLLPDVADRLAADFPAMEDMPMIFREPMSYKGQLSNIEKHAPAFADIFGVLQGDEFLSLISAITKIEKLERDDFLAGGGLHQSVNSGFLDLHVDANFHPVDKSLHRRVNILIYVTKNWDSSYGGELELWSDGGKKPKDRIRAVTPLFNRAVIFSTTRTSWHGVTAIHCPEGQTRKSIALYYYTKTRPDTELYRDSSVIWQNRKSPLKRVLYPVMNGAIALLKPIAPQLRKVLGRGKVFDALKK